MASLEERIAALVAEATEAAISQVVSGTDTETTTEEPVVQEVNSSSLQSSGKSGS